MNPAQKEAFRREVLEEAAMVADHCHVTGVMGAQVVATAIRAFAASQPAPAADTGPRYECREIGEGGWRLCSKAEYDHFSKDPNHDTRIVEPAADTGQAVEAVAKILWERFSPDHEVEWPSAHADEYRLAAKDILNHATHPAPLDAERVREAALRLSCEDQFAVASYLSANLGYEMQPEPLHPDTPKPGAFEHGAAAIAALRQKEPSR